MLKIGDFARLCQLPVGTLRYYDDLDLLRPAHVDALTGYRYYSVEQLPRLNRLLALKDLGFSLEQIARVLNDGVTPEQLRGMLMLARAEAEHRLGAEQDRLHRIEARLREIEQEGHMPVSEERMAKELSGTLDNTSFAHLGTRHRGKVRDSYVEDGIRTIVTTDRQSAFDRVLGTIPFKGQALNEIANFWFDATADIVPNHLLAVPDPNVVRVRECELVPLEFVVRGYITGVTKTSLWFNYEQGQREVAGNQLGEGLRKNQRLPEPILTPSTKLEEHDRNISRAEAISEGLITAELFDRIASLSFALFARGTELAAGRGLILVDTKYEFGLAGDEVVLIDEVHTPDSSRFWYADTYEELFAAGKEQRALDKEPLREWFVERGFRGDGEAPSIPDEIRVATATRYIALAEEITRRPFEATPQTARERVSSLLAV
jgi:phosphoribosylaminoimidazole-succinocarboxamide synthase